MNIIIAKLKNAWKSWTIWLNGIGLAILGALPMLQDSFPAMQPYLPARLDKWIMGVIVAANILLRFKTNTALEHK